MALPKYENLKKEILMLSHPIGSPYITQEDVNPSTILGFGIWERTKGRVLVGLDEDDEYFNKIGKEGGSTTHSLSLAEMPNHGGHLPENRIGKGAAKGAFLQNMGSYGEVGRGWDNSSNEYYPASVSCGLGTAFEITQPYKVVGYMWIRTA